jgi:hypothetical protein
VLLGRCSRFQAPTDFRLDVVEIFAGFNRDVHDARRSHAWRRPSRRDGSVRVVGRARRRVRGSFRRTQS